MTQPVLVIAAHPDDEVLGSGGTIALLSRNKREVHIVILGEGLTSRRPAREQTPVAEVDELAKTAERVSDFLGAAAVHQFGFPDNRFDQVPLLDVVKTIEQLISDLRPAKVFTQHGGDLNIDHSVVFRATMTATRPVKGHTVRALYGYEVMSSSEWAFGEFAPRFQPNYFVDISSTLDQKIQALAMYESESREFPHPRSPEAIRAKARSWGSAVGCDAAEAFQQVWRLG